MKKAIILFSTFFLLFLCESSAQISTLPYTEGFEIPFTQGTNIDFVPNFNGNTVASTNRIYQDGTSHHGGAAACAVVPTSSFTGIILVHLNLTGYSNVFFNFWAASGVNGTGSRPDLVEISTSVDNGVTYNTPTPIGDSVIFANSNTNWNNYQYSLPYFAFNNSNVFVKIKISRGDGTGTTARWLMDDATFDFSLTDVTPPVALDAFATGANQIKVAYSEPVNATADSATNYSGLGGFTGTTNSLYGDTVTINLTTALTLGHWYYVTISNVQDVAGNAMTAPQQFVISFNDNTGNIKITEIYYNNPGTDSLSFVELRNMDVQPINVGGWKFTKGLNGYFPSDLTMQPGDYIVFAEIPSAVNSFFNITSYFAAGSLSNSGENIAVYNSADGLIDSVSYSSSLPWDTMANGYGPSLVLCNEADDNDLPSSWTAATTFAGLYFNVDSVFANPMNNCSLTAGVESLEKEKGFSVYPNPFHDELNLNLPSGETKKMNLEIFDVAGKMVMREIVESHPGMCILNTKDLNSGFYFLRIDGETFIIVKQ